jgi:hypothetical protein
VIYVYRYYPLGNYLSLESHLLSLLKGKCLLLLGLNILTLLAHHSTTPSTSDINVVIVLRSEGLAQSVKLSLVLLTDSGNGNGRTVLLVNQSTKTRLGLENAERNILLSAKSREPNNKLNWVNIMSNNNQLGLLILNSRSDLMETIDERRRLLLSGILSSSLGLGNFLQALLLLLLSLWNVVLQQLQQLSRLILVKSVAELIDHRRDL